MQIADNFNRADNVDLGSSWTPQASGRDAQIVSNQVRCLAATRTVEQYTGLTPRPDQWAQVKIATAGAGADITIGILLRCGSTGTENYYSFRAIISPSGANTSDIGKRVAGAATSLAASAAVTWATNDLVLGIVQGTTLTLYQNGVSTGLTSTGDTAFSSGGAGIYLFGGTALSDDELDDFIAGDYPYMPKPVLQGVQRGAFF